MYPSTAADIPRQVDKAHGSNPVVGCRAPCCGALVLMSVLTAGCERVLPMGEQRAASQVHQEWVEALLEGLQFGTSGVARAAGYEQRTRELKDVAIDRGDLIMTAERGIILIDSNADTVSLKLFEVRGVDAEAGEMSAWGEMVLGPVDVGVDVVEEGDSVPPLRVPGI